MNAFYHSETFTDDFEIDLAEKNKCKGVFKLEIQLHPLSIPLLIKDGSGQIINSKKPFVVASNHPIVGGLLRFEFSEYPELVEAVENSFKKAIVRYLYCE